MSSDVGALYESVYAKLNGYNPIWGNRVQPNQTVTAVTRPYVQFFIAGGGGLPSDQARRTSQYSLLVKIVSENMQEAVNGQASIDEALHNTGTQDTGSIPVNGEWQITTVTREDAVWLEEMFDNVKPIYHAGYYYSVTLEKN